MRQQVVQPVDLRLLSFGRERLIAGRDQACDVAVLGFYNLLGRDLSVVDLMQLITIGMTASPVPSSLCDARCTSGTGLAAKSSCGACALAGPQRNTESSSNTIWAAEFNDRANGSLSLTCTVSIPHHRMKIPSKGRNNLRRRIHHLSLAGVTPALFQRGGEMHTI